MSNVTLAQLQEQFKQAADLKARLKAAGITHDRVAEAANVGRTQVVNVLAGRAKSQNVMDTAERLLARNGKAKR